MISVSEWIRSALAIANSGPHLQGPLGVVHRDRSRRFVEAMGKIARDNAESDSERVLTKHYAENRQEFGLNELLFDVLYCDTATTPAAEAGVMLRYITRGKWAVESEFSRDSREALFDFNKLILADTEAKLFVGSLTSNWKDFLRPFAAAARHVKGQLFLALIPHPSEWKSKENQDLKIFRWSDGDWREE